MGFRSLHSLPVILRRERKRASKDESAGLSPFEGRASHGHLRVTVKQL